MMEIDSKKVLLIELAVIYPSFYFLDSGIGCLTTVCPRIIFLYLTSKDTKQQWHIALQKKYKIGKDLFYEKLSANLLMQVLRVNAAVFRHWMTFGVPGKFLVEAFV